MAFLKVVSGGAMLANVFAPAFLNAHKQREYTHGQRHDWPLGRIVARLPPRHAARYRRRLRRNRKRSARLERGKDHFCGSAIAVAGQPDALAAQVESLDGAWITPG